MRENPINESPQNASKMSTPLINDNVMITEYPMANINPQPRCISKNDDILDEFLSPRRLKQLSGKEDLSEVNTFEMCIDSERISIGNFGSYMPNLKELKLTNSIIPKIRDLGTSLDNLIILWMPHCCLECLYGVASLPMLRELYLSYNELFDISPLGMLEQLEILDLEGNLISDEANLFFLSICVKLKNLTLEGNPIARDKNGYRNKVLDVIPSLETLDNTSTLQNVSLSIMDTPEDFSKEWDHINELMKEIGLVKYNDRNLITNIDEARLLSLNLDKNRLQSGRVGNQFRIPAEIKRLTQPALIGRNGLIINTLCKTSSSNDNAPDVSSVRSESGSPRINDLGTENGEAICGDIGRALRRKVRKYSTSGCNHKKPFDQETPQDEKSLDGIDWDETLALLSIECEKMLSKTEKVRVDYIKNRDLFKSKSLKNIKSRPNFTKNESNDKKIMRNDLQLSRKPSITPTLTEIIKKKCEKRTSQSNDNKSGSPITLKKNKIEPVKLLKRRSPFVQKLQPLKAIAASTEGDVAIDTRDAMNKKSDVSLTLTQEGNERSSVSSNSSHLVSEISTTL